MITIIIMYLLTYLELVYSTVALQYSCVQHCSAPPAGGAPV